MKNKQTKTSEKLYHDNRNYLQNNIRVKKQIVFEVIEQIKVSDVSIPEYSRIF